MVFIGLNFCLASAEKFTDFLKHTAWKVNCSPFENKDQETIVLTEKQSLTMYDGWGYSITFDSLKFQSSYSAPCGNDCFTSVKGLYFFVGENRLKIYVEEIVRNGFCSKESEVVNKTVGFYDIAKTETGYQLKKVD